MSVGKEFFMSKEIHTQKHMTLSDRIYIEQALVNHDSFKDTAAILKEPVYHPQGSSQTQGFQGGQPLSTRQAEFSLTEQFPVVCFSCRKS